MTSRLMLLLIVMVCSCNPQGRNYHIAIFSTVEALQRGDTTRTGFFTNASLFDTAYHAITYETARGSVTVPNDGTQNFLLCRYDTTSLKPIWVAVGGGRGGDGGINYHTVPSEHAVYVVGCFEDTAYFPRFAGSEPCDTLVSRGYADMFIAKYDYETGALQWIRSGGSRYSDVVFMYEGTRHQEVFMIVDSAAVTVYTNCFGPAHFGDTIINAKLEGEAVWIRYDKETGDVLGAGKPIALPTYDEQ